MIPVANRRRAAALALLLGAASLVLLLFARPAAAYPPAVGVLGKSRNCIACHTNDGPWKDDERLVLDLVDRESGTSLRQKEGSFLLSAKPGQRRVVLVVIGRAKGDSAAAPKRNGWVFVDLKRIDDDHLGPKFAPDWEVDLAMSCRLTGDMLKGREGASLSVLPMTVSAGTAAGDAEVEWQILMTSGEAVKGDAKAGLAQNYFERKLKLHVER